MTATAEQIIHTDDYKLTTVDGEKTNKKRKNCTVRNNYMTEAILDSPIYNEEMIDYILMGISQNILIQLRRQGMTVRGLSKLSGINDSTMCRFINDNVNIRISTFIKIAAALQVSPAELFPIDCNKRKTNGQRFDEITAGMSVKNINYLLDMAVGLSKINNFDR